MPHTNGTTFSHHAYLIEGGAAARAELLTKIAGRDSGIGALKRNSPDFFDRSYQTFSIDDARELKLIAEMRPVSEGDLKVFIISLDSITVEAQNALLKLLEEPPAYARFFFIVPSEHILVPTMKSRLSRLSYGEAGKEGALESHDEFAALAKRFVTASPTRRLEQVKELVDDIGKEKRPKRDAVRFLDALQAHIYAERGPVRAAADLAAVERARKYATDRAPSFKMLFESMALELMV